MLYEDLQLPPSPAMASNERKKAKRLTKQNIHEAGINYSRLQNKAANKNRLCSKTCGVDKLEKMSLFSYKLILKKSHLLTLDPNLKRNGGTERKKLDPTSKRIHLAKIKEKKTV